MYADDIHLYTNLSISKQSDASFLKDSQVTKVYHLKLYVRVYYCMVVNFT